MSFYMDRSLADELYSEILKPKAESDQPSTHHITQPRSVDDEDEEWYGDGSSWNDADATLDLSSDLDREWQRRKNQFYAIGYRDGLIAGKEASAQQGFNIGFQESVLVGFNFGLVRGVTGALECLPSELREKIVESPETRNKFHQLYESVNKLSTTDALKAFGDDLSKREVKPGGQTDCSVLNGCYRQLQSLIVECPAVEVQSWDKTIGVSSSDKEPSRE
ncbi:putative essential protein Yae1 [Helianthus annuus]|nr:putative essential protein Yae1 [Helianthus annuus]